MAAECCYFLTKMESHFRASYLKRFVYGNVSHRLEKIEEIGTVKPVKHTHKWTVYVRPFRKEDMSCYVKKVVFVLHESYEKSRRTVNFPPYEVTETGWGEFDIRIEIYLKGPVEGPVVLKHDLALTSKVSESFVELLFKNRSYEMSQLLWSRPILYGSWGYQSLKFEKFEKWVVDKGVKKENKKKKEKAG